MARPQPCSEKCSEPCVSCRLATFAAVYAVGARAASARRSPTAAPVQKHELDPCLASALRHQT
eukprot:1567854-Prymnesium_polylepis.1